MCVFGAIENNIISPNFQTADKDLSDLVQANQINSINRLAITFNSRLPFEVLAFCVVILFIVLNHF